MAKITKDKAKPLLKNLDDLFDGMNSAEQPGTEQQPVYQLGVTLVAMDKLTPFNGHPFRLYEGERLDDMVESIRANGVLVPIIVRRVDDVLEILSGHNRVNAAKLAGLIEIPALIHENVSDDDAMAYVIETNLIQRSFSDMTHTEKAAVIALHHSKMFSQGKRNDILEQIKKLEKPHEYKENSTSSQVAKKLTTIEKVGETYNLSKDTVARYLRIQQLIPTLKSRVDNGSIAFIPAVTLSFLKEEEQMIVADCMEHSGLSVDMKKAEILRKCSEDKKIKSESVAQILSGAAKPKTSDTVIIKIDKAVYTKYFKQNQPAKEVQAAVEKALGMYFDNR